MPVRIGPTGHEYALLGAWIYTKIAVTALRHVNVKASNQQTFLCSMRRHSSMTSLWNILPLFHFFSINLNAIYRTSPLAFPAADAVIHIYGKAGADNIVTIFAKADVLLGAGPLLHRILECYKTFPYTEHMTKRHPHACKQCGD